MVGEKATFAHWAAKPTESENFTAEFSLETAEFKVVHCNLSLARYEIIQ